MMKKEERLGAIKIFNIDGKRLLGTVEVNLEPYNKKGNYMPAQTKLQLPQWLCAEIYNLVYAEYASNCGETKDEREK